MERGRIHIDFVLQHIGNDLVFEVDVERDLLEQLRGTFHQLRQSGIDEELFDVISGFEALGGSR